MRKISRRLAALGCATTLMAGSIGALSAAPASAASMKCSLSINNWSQDPAYERYEWSCVNRPRVDRILYFDFMGSDPWYDEEDLLYTEYDAQYDFRWGTVKDTLLNEDGDDKGDEIYVKFQVRRPNGSTYSVSSNKVNKNYNS